MKLLRFLERFGLFECGTPFQAWLKVLQSALDGGQRDRGKKTADWQITAFFCNNQVIL